MRCDSFALKMEIGDTVKILRSDKKTVTEVTVVEFNGSKDDRYFRAPELPTFRVEFVDPSRGHNEKLTKWCAAHDLIDDKIDHGGFHLRPKT